MPKRFILDRLLDRARGRTGEQGSAHLLPESGQLSPPGRRLTMPARCGSGCIGTLYAVIPIGPTPRRYDGCLICRACGTVYCPEV